MWPLYQRLKRQAERLLGTRSDMGHDFAVDVIEKCLREVRAGSNAPWREYWFASKVLRHDVIDARKKAKHRIELQPAQVCSIETVLTPGTVSPTQEMNCLLNDVATRLQTIPAYGSYIERSGVGDTLEENASYHGVEVKEVQWRLRQGRALLRKEGYWDDQRLTASRYPGIKRAHRKWSAEIIVRGQYVYLGLFETASEAASAYAEAKARAADQTTINEKVGK